MLKRAQGWNVKPTHNFSYINNSSQSKNNQNANSPKVQLLWFKKLICGLDCMIWDKSTELFQVCKSSLQKEITH